MPLLKLWNSLRGQATNSAPSHPGDTQAPQERSTETSQSSTGRAVKSAPKSTFGIFRGGPHSPLQKRLRALSVSSVLEIGVGDGSQAVAVMETLSGQSDTIRYYGIDEFEMAGGVNLKEFHQHLRNHNIHPRLFPGSVDRALMQIAHTVGAVDLVLVADSGLLDEHPAIAGLLARVSHPATTVLVSRDETWVSMQVSTMHASREAA
jgi:hypothetical protein